MSRTPTKEEINKRVKRGAAWLDTRAPGWERKINLQTLDLQDCDRCVIGQIHGCYWDGMGTLKPKRSCDEKAMLAWSTKRGFDTRQPHAYPMLRKAWVRFIKARFDSGMFSDN